MDSPARHYDVVILGGGFAGVYCARQAVKRLARQGKKVALIASENHMVFQPMLPEVVGGSLSPRHVVNPIRLICPGVEVLKGTVFSVDLPGRKLALTGGHYTPSVHVTFEHLVLALGSDVDLSRIPGMGEHAYLVRNAGDAMKLRAAIIARMEEANLMSDAAARRHLLNFVVVGGGYSGVETAGQMMDLLRSVARFYDNIGADECCVTLVHSGDHLLPMLSESLAIYTEKKLAQMGVKLLLKKRVRAVTAKLVVLDDGTKLEASTVVCTVGNAPHPLIVRLGSQHGITVERGKILVHPSGLALGQTYVWSAGDCASFPKASGGVCPETAQFAYRQGITVGENVARALAGKTLEPFTFTGLGELASIGHRSAVANLMGVNFSGVLAWFMWRTIYLLKLPGLDRKLRVMSEWTFDLFFPRDINLLTPQYSSPMEEMHLETGDLLFVHGEPAFSFYAVKSGCVHITDDQGELVKAAKKGDHFGERALLGDRIWRFDATAAEPTTLVAINARTFDKLVSSIGSLNKLFTRTAETYDRPEQIEQVLGTLPHRARYGTAQDLMVTEVATLSEDAVLQDALDLFAKERHSAYPVVDSTGGIKGLLRRADCYEWLKHHAFDTRQRVRDLAVRPALVVAPETPLPEVFETLIRTGASKAVVCNPERKLVGMLTLYDLLTCGEETHADSTPNTPPAA
ncbi:MAG: FAD-dependent oxidoreductase [Roseimicrobium sp.]